MKRALLCGLGLVAACVPSGSAPPYDAGATATAAAPTFKPSSNVMTAVFEDNFDRPDSGFDDAGLLPTPDAAPAASGSASAAPSASASASAPASASAGYGDAGQPLTALEKMIHEARTEAGAGPERPSNLGPNWVQSRTNAWHIENGKLCGENAYNHGVWLQRVLPINARIEFDAEALTTFGDLKTEVWGDGQSGATTVSYTNATSYLAILGGWKNQYHVLARINEHAPDRHEIKVDPESDDPRQKPVVKGQVYRFKVERNDGKSVHFSVDGVEYHTWVDPQPLAGAGHDHFGFNEWTAKTCYDNVKVTPL